MRRTRRLIMDLYFTYESRDILKTSKALETEYGARSPDNAEFGHFTLSFCRGRLRNVPRV